jgi:hypothetical protein
MYLTSFWTAIGPKIPGNPALDTVNAQVFTEYVIENDRRIDIVIKDRSIFVPLEVKINAGEQPEQVADYGDFSRKNTPEKGMPVLFLTPEGRKPESARDAESFVCLSFREDIVPWLETCREQTGDCAPVREALKQLIAAIKSFSFYGYSEDTDMENEILSLICESNDSMRAALAISGVMGKVTNEGIQGIFEHTILSKVQQRLSQAHWHEETGTYASWGIVVPLAGHWELYINYDWGTLGIYEDGGETNDVLYERLVKKLDELYPGRRSLDPADGGGYHVCYPGLDDADESMYPYRLYAVYTTRPDEVAKRIVDTVKALEEVSKKNDKH